VRLHLVLPAEYVQVWRRDADPVESMAAQA